MAKGSEMLRENAKKAEREKNAAIQELNTSKQIIEEMRSKISVESFVQKESMREDFLQKEVEKLKRELEISKAEKEIYLEARIIEKDE